MYYYSKILLYEAGFNYFQHIPIMLYSSFTTAFCHSLLMNHASYYYFSKYFYSYILFCGSYDLM